MRSCISSNDINVCMQIWRLFIAKPSQIPSHSAQVLKMCYKYNYTTYNCQSLSKLVQLTITYKDGTSIPRVFSLESLCFPRGNPPHPCVPITAPHQQHVSLGVPLHPLRQQIIKDYHVTLHLYIMDCPYLDTHYLYIAASFEGPNKFPSGRGPNLYQPTHIGTGYVLVIMTESSACHRVLMT